MEIIWYRLTQVHLEMAIKTEREKRGLRVANKVDDDV